MHRISVTNQKGGVGKTTITAHLAVGLSRMGYSVLAMDFDPQGYLTRHFGKRTELYNADIDNLARQLVGSSETDASSLVVETEEGVDLIPSNYDMRGLEDALSNARNREKQLKGWIDSIGSTHDFLVIDSPPNLGVLSDNSILATEKLVVPIQAEDFSIDAIEMLKDEIDEIEDAFNTNVEIIGIIPNLVPEDGIATSTLETLRSTPVIEDLMFPYEVDKRAGIKYAARDGQTLFEYDGSADMIPVFERLAEDIEKQVH